MIRARAAAGLLAALAVAGCGAQKHPPALHTPAVKAQPSPVGAPVSRAEVAVIRGWSDHLRRGRVAAATRYFALPATVANGATVVLHNRREVRRFNRTLPCGAELARWQRAPPHFVVATFKLTDRVGSHCDAPAGTLAAVAFLIRRRHIVEWLRVDVPDRPSGQTAS
jgi:hypothetical protein